MHACADRSVREVEAEVADHILKLQRAARPQQQEMPNNNFQRAIDTLPPVPYALTFFRRCFFVDFSFLKQFTHKISKRKNNNTKNKRYPIITSSARSTHCPLTKYKIQIQKQKFNTRTEWPIDISTHFSRTLNKYYNMISFCALN